MDIGNMGRKRRRRIFAALVLGICLMVSGGLPLPSFAEASVDDSSSADSNFSYVGDSLDSESQLESDPGDDKESSDAVQVGVEQKVAKTSDHASLDCGTFFVTSALSGQRVLDAKGGGTISGTPIQLYSRNETPAQQFEVIDLYDGTYAIRNVKSGLYLAYPSDTSLFSSNPVLQLRSDTESGYGYSWVAKKVGNGFVLSPSADDSYAVDIAGGSDANGTQIRLYQANGTAAQSFTFEKPKSQLLSELAADHSGDVPDGTYLIRSAKNNWMVLDVSGGSKQSGANVQLYSQNVSDAQLWTVTHDASGFVTLINKGSGRALDVSGGSAQSGANVQQYAPNGSWAQKWIAVTSKDGGVRLVSALDPQLVLDLSAGTAQNGQNIQIYSDNGSAAQRWNFLELDSSRSNLDADAPSLNAAIQDGTYILTVGAGKRKVLDVQGGSTSNSANVQSYTSNMTPAQQWNVSHTADGYLVFTNVKSGKVLDVAGGSCSQGANIAQYDFNGTRAQKWIALPGSVSGAYVIESALFPNLVLDVNGGSSSDGANIQLYGSNSSAAQQFTFVSTSPEVAPCDDLGLDGWYEISPIDNDALSFDISGGSSSNGANLQTYAKNGTYAQTFRFEYHDGYYLIVSAQSDKAIDMDAGNICPGTNAQQWTAAPSSANQLFSVSKNQDGSYCFVNKASGLALSVVGSNVEGSLPSDAGNQKFSVTKRTSLLPEGFYSIASAINSSSVLDVASGSDSEGANVQIYASNGSTAQKWKVTQVADRDNTYTIESLVSGRVLTVDSKGNVSACALRSDESQYWTVDISCGYTVFVNVSSGLVLDVAGASVSNGTNVQTYRANQSNAQRFKLSTCALVNSGTYTIVSSASRSKALDVANGSRSNGANIQLWSSNGSGAQKWNISVASDNTCTIQNCRSKKYLDVLNANASSGANVQQWQGNGNNAQRWRIVYVGNGGFELHSLLNNDLVLDVSGGQLSDGSNVQIYLANQTEAQHWSFKQTSYTPEAVNLGVPVYNQYAAGLPNGCESAALTNVLNYYGFGLGPCEMADRWIPRSSWDFVWCYWGDPHSYSNGNEISAPGLTRAANNFLASRGSGLRAYDVTGTSLYDLCNYLDDGYPVIIWTTVGQGNVGNIYARQGNYFACVNSHTVVLKGYDPQSNKVMLSDSIDGYTTWDRGWLAWVYSQRGSQAVVIR